jgi:hypothetical protein
MKQKHLHADTSDSSLMLSTGKGRGRPRKNYGRVTKISPESSDFFKTIDKHGGPTDPLFSLEDTLSEICKLFSKPTDPLSHPFYLTMKKLSYEETPGNPEGEDPAVVMEFGKMGEEERQNLSCDEIFAVYLREVSQKVNERFYKLVVRFIIGYRE